MCALHGFDDGDEEAGATIERIDESPQEPHPSADHVQNHHVHLRHFLHRVSPYQTNHSMTDFD